MAEKQIMIDADEEYPVYGYRQPNSTELAWAPLVDEETLARWDRVLAEYAGVQDEMSTVDLECRDRRRKAGRPPEKPAAGSTPPTTHTPGC